MIQAVPVLSNDRGTRVMGKGPKSLGNDREEIREGRRRRPPPGLGWHSVLAPLWGPWGRGHGRAASYLNASPVSNHTERRRAISQQRGILLAAARNQ